MADTQAHYKVIADGTVASVTPGTAVRFNGGTSYSCRRVFVTALAENKGPVCVGGSTVLATSGAGRGKQLAPGETFEFPVADVNMLYLDAQNAGDAVSYFSLKGTD